MTEPGPGFLFSILASATALVMRVKGCAQFEDGAAWWTAVPVIGPYICRRGYHHWICSQGLRHRNEPIDPERTHWCCWCGRPAWGPEKDLR